MGGVVLFILASLVIAAGLAWATAPHDERVVDQKARDDDDEGGEV